MKTEEPLIIPEAISKEQKNLFLERFSADAKERVIYSAPKQEGTTLLNVTAWIKYPVEGGGFLMDHGLYFASQMHEDYSIKGRRVILLLCGSRYSGNFWNPNIPDYFLYPWISLMGTPIDNGSRGKRNWMTWILPTPHPAQMPDTLLRLAQYADENNLPHARTLTKWALGTYSPENVIYLTSKKGGKNV